MSTAPNNDVPAPAGPPANGTAPPNGSPPPAFPDHPNWATAQRVAVGAAGVGLGVYLVAGLINLFSAHGEHEQAAKGQFFLSWTVGFVYWMSLPVGAMAMLFIHYLAKTSWGLLLKRFFEASVRTLPLMFVLFIPVAVGASLHGISPYWWTDPDERMITDEMRAAQDRYDTFLEHQARGQPARLDANTGSLVMQKRAIERELEERKEGTFGFLSPPMFVVLSVLYFVIWGVFIYFLNKWGNAADDDPAQVEPSLEKAKNLSGPGLIMFAIVGTAAASHWVMSLETSWASTMFPVVYSVNQMLCALAFGVACFMTLVVSGPPVYAKIIRTKFKIDMGSLLLALTLFWSYTSFSQLMLVWIGNLPEEIPFFLKRSMPTYGGWWCVSLFLILFHFAFPFVVLLFRDVKNHPKRLRAMALYLLVVCAVDVAWWLEPAVPHEGQPLFWVMDIGALVGIGGLWGVFFIYQVKKRRLLPVNELYMLPEDHDHAENNHEHH
ncbi:MAG TPA: hypothetical protein VKE74_16085 [Gemmataceae bacterium]|nr:hypothetical protein [Gemmataceae bacterium]